MEALLLVVVEVLVVEVLVLVLVLVAVVVVVVAIMVEVARRRWTVEGCCQKARYIHTPSSKDPHSPPPCCAAASSFLPSRWPRFR